MHACDAPHVCVPAYVCVYLCLMSTLIRVKACLKQRWRSKQATDCHAGNGGGEEDVRREEE